MTFQPQSVITSVLKPLGYRRDGNYWLKEAETHLYYLVLYSSSYGGPDKYIDIRAFFKELAKPGENFKNSRNAAYSIQETGPLGGALNFHHEFKDLTDEERVFRLRQGLINHALPVLEEFSTIDGLKRFWLENNGVLMDPELRSLIGLPFKKPERA